MNIRKKYKLILNQNTFLWVKNNKGLIYQSSNYQSFAFFLSGKLYGICQRLLEIESLYVVELTEVELIDHEVRKFVDKVDGIDAGKLILANDEAKGTVSLMPVLKIQDQINDFVWKHEQGTGGSIIRHIHELTFYINGSKYGDDHYYLQTIFPIRDNSTLKSEKIIHFIRNSRNLFLSNINLAGNIFSYPGYIELINNIVEYEIPVNICITAGDFLDHEEQIKSTVWHEKISFNILVEQKSDFDQLSTVLNDTAVPYSTTFLVFSEQDYLNIEHIVTTLNGVVAPVYNGVNINFFESFVLIDREDILSSSLSKREVFMRQATNMYHFGKLTILPDGKVYADVNQVPLGTIDDTVYSIVYKEFTEGKSWFRIRAQAPCTDCVYQWLCPSPSNYETVIGRSNLCHVKQ